MAGDWTVYWLASPFGLILIAIVIGVSFVLWRVTLAMDFAAIGIKPLAWAYPSAGLGLLVMNFVGCHIDFSNRVASGILSESQRWSIVPGWTVYSTILLLVIVLPLLAFVAVPVVAIVLKRALLTPTNIAVSALVVWLALSSLGWAFPGNEWHRTHRLASFLMWLKDLLPGILCIVLPFMLAIYKSTRSYRLQSSVGIVVFGK